MTNSEYNNREILINAINDNGGNEYVNSSIREDEIENIVITRASIDDFKKNQLLDEEVSTPHGKLYYFIAHKCRRLCVMDFGDYCLSLI